MQETSKPNRIHFVFATLGAFYAGSLAILTILMVLFQHLAEEVLEGEMAGTNHAILLAIHHTASPGLDTLAIAFTRVGGTIGTALLGFLAVVWLLQVHKKVEALALTVSLIGGTILVVTLKPHFQQIRPDLFPSIYPAVGYSFPSGHALMSVCLYGCLAGERFLEHPNSWVSWVIGVLLLLMAVTIDWSRLYLGVHWPSDVVGGYLVGSIWVGLCLLGIHHVKQRASIASAGH